MVGKIALTLALVLVLTCVLAASNPVPLIYQPLNPSTVTPGHAAFVLTVHGTGFVSGAVVKGNGVAFLTKFVDAATLQAEVPPRYVAKAGTGSITVANPGSIDSNVVYFTIRKPSQSVVLATDAQTIEGGLMAVADFNNDHVPDLTVTGSNVDVYLNIDYPRLANFEKVAGPAFTQNILFGPIMVADFNNDGNLDVAPCGGDGGPDPTVCDIYFGDGKGDLTLGTSAQVVYAGVMADINGDGILDNIATWGDGYESYLSISLGNGDGTYTNVTTVPTAVPGVPVVGDFNGDGKLDVATSIEGSSEPGPGTVAVFLGNGDGTVQNEVDYQIPWGGYNAVVADVNGDGKLDIITCGFSVLLGNGDGTFSVGTSFDLQDNWNAQIQVADMNGDGKLDLVTVSSNFGHGIETLNILLGSGNGTFRRPIMLPIPLGSSASGIADFNADGLLDIGLSGVYQSTVLLQVPSK